MTDPEKYRRKRESNPGSAVLKADALTTWPPNRSLVKKERHGRRATNQSTPLAVTFTRPELRNRSEPNVR